MRQIVVSCLQICWGQYRLVKRIPPFLDASLSDFSERQVHLLYTHNFKRTTLDVELLFVVVSPWTVPITSVTSTSPFRYVRLLELVGVEHPSAEMVPGVVVYTQQLQIQPLF